MAKEVKKPEDRVWDKASLEILSKAESDCIAAFAGQWEEFGLQATGDYARGDE